jgi:drug/metabolite transporter (DMT)-like permease
MTYIVLALLAHFGNALVFIVDKGLLSSSSAISQPLRLTFYSGIVSAATIVLLPLGWAMPNMFVITWSALAAAFFLIALWVFFAALKEGESSRVVPVIGSAVPLFTLLFAVMFLQERLAALELWAVALLIAGGALLSVRLSGAEGMTGKVLAYTLLGGAAFAAHFAAIKYVYENFEPFIAAFVYSRVAVALLAGVLLGPIVLLTRNTKSVAQKKRRSGRSQTKWILLAFFGSKIIGSAAFLTQNYAISLGSVTIVNALQGTQYIFVLLLALAISIWFPRLFREEMQRVAIIQKLGGIVCISIGLALLL